MKIYRDNYGHYWIKLRDYHYRIFDPRSLAGFIWLWIEEVVTVPRQARPDQHPPAHPPVATKEDQ
jgi:hypothetical protein